MKSTILRTRLIVFWTLLLVTVSVRAVVYNSDNIPMPYLTDERQHTCNPDGVLSEAAVAQIDTLLYKAEHEKGVQAIAIVVKNVEDADVYSFGMAVAQKYKMGSAKKSTGLLFILATEDRSYYILTGDGMEGTLPDAICKRIENYYMLPYLKESDWDSAMVQAVTKACDYINGDDTLQVEEEEADDMDDSALIIFLIFFSGGLGIIAFSVWQSTRCPHCGAHKLQRQSSVLVSKSKGVKIKKVTYVCLACGHVVTKTEKEYDDNYTSGGGPIIFGGGNRSGFGGGGGFSGGSFGGGHFSGGGAGGRF